MALSKVIVVLFAVVMTSLAEPDPQFGFPSYVYNRQYFVPSYSYRVPSVQYVQPSNYQLPRQDIGVSYGPIRYQPVVTSVRQVYYEPQGPVLEPAAETSASVPAKPAEPTETRRVVPPLRAIFPDFSRGGLRSSADIGFLRPDEVKPLPQKFLSPNIISF